MTLTPDALALPPGLDGTIQEAIAELEQSIMEAKLNDDPLRLPLSALASFLRAQQRLYVDATLTVGQQIEAAKQPISEEDIRRLTQAATNGAQRSTMELARAANWRTLLIAVLVWAGSLTIAVGSTWYIAQSSMMTAVAGIERRLTGPEAEQWLVLMQNNDLLASNKTCGPEDGRTACSIVLWTAPLPPPSLAPAKR
jgi:hypothetical protein